MPSMRIGDLERDQAADSLSRHFAAGRLDRDEFDERLAAAYSAKHTADLLPLFEDLPGTSTIAAPALAPATVRVRHGSPAPFVALLALVLVVSSIVAASHGFPLVLLFVALWVWRGGRHHRHLHRYRG